MDSNEYENIKRHLSHIIHDKGNKLTRVLTLINENDKERNLLFPDKNILDQNIVIPKISELAELFLQTVDGAARQLFSSLFNRMYLIAFHYFSNVILIGSGNGTNFYTIAYILGTKKTMLDEKGLYNYYKRLYDNGQELDSNKYFEDIVCSTSEEKEKLRDKYTLKTVKFEDDKIIREIEDIEQDTFYNMYRLYCTKGTFMDNPLLKLYYSYVFDEFLKLGDKFSNTDRDKQELRNLFDRLKKNKTLKNVTTTQNVGKSLTQSRPSVPPVPSGPAGPSVPAEDAKDKMIQELREKLENTETELEEARTDPNTTPDEINSLRALADELKNGLQDFETEKQQFDTERQQLIQQKNDLENKLKQIQNKKSKKYDSLKQKKDETDQQLKELNQELTQLKDQIVRIKTPPPPPTPPSPPVVSVPAKKTAQIASNIVTLSLGLLKTEILYYTCIIHSLLKMEPNGRIPTINSDGTTTIEDVYINPIFRTYIRDHKRKYDDQFRLNRDKEIHNPNITKDRIKELHKLSKTDFELLKGPVRVYLKLRTFVAAMGDKKERGIFPENVNNYYQIRFKNNFAFNDLRYMENVDTKIKDMTDNSKTHLFSTIYYSNDDAQKIFDDSIKDTIDNIVPTQGSSIIIGYGPSGSGKTTNLIGLMDDFKLKPGKEGIIYKVLNYLTQEYNQKANVVQDNKIKTIELSSWQYYMICGYPFTGVYKNNTPTTTYYCKKFYSLKLFNHDIIKEINDKNIKLESFNTHLKDYLNNVLRTQKKVISYKYLRDENHTSAIPGERDGIHRVKKVDYENDSKKDLTIKKFINNNISEFEPKYINGNKKWYELDEEITKMLSTNFADIFNNIVTFKKTFTKFEDEYWIYNLEENLFYRELYKNNNTIVKISHLETAYGKLANATKTLKFSNDQYIQKIFGLVRLTVANEFNKGEKIDFIKHGVTVQPGDELAAFEKEGRQFVINELIIFRTFLKRFVEFGDVTYKTFDNFFEKIENNNRMKLDPITLELAMDNNPDTKKKIKDKFTKFYNALVVSRPTRGTPNNQDSSRSHLVINIKITTQDGGHSNVRFVDLAGNEKAEGNYGIMRQEGNGITTSLLAIKELLQIKQSTDIDRQVNAVKKTLSDKDMNMFFKSCTTKKQQNTCKRLYSDIMDIFELQSDEDEKFAELGNDKTTVSLYLNLPTYLKRKGDSNNQSAAIADSLYFIEKLQKETKSMNSIRYAQEKNCKKEHDAYMKHMQNKFGRYRKKLLSNIRKHKRRKMSYGRNRRKISKVYLERSKMKSRKPRSSRSSINKTKPKRR